MPRPAVRPGASRHLMLIAATLLGLNLALAGDSVAQRISLEAASAKVYETIARLPQPDDWQTNPAKRFRLEPVGGGVFELCEDAGDGDECRRLCATATRTRTDVTPCSPTTNLGRVRLHVLVRGFGDKVTAEDVVLRARRGAGISITKRDVDLHRAGGKAETVHAQWFHNWPWPDPQLFLVLSKEPPKDNPWFPRVSGKKAGSDEASIAVKLPGLLPEHSDEPLFLPKGLKALQECLKKGGAVADASLVALQLPSKSDTLGLVLGSIGAGKPALFGTELPCTRTNGCTKDSVNVKLGILKVTGERAAVNAAKAAGVLEFRVKPVVTCDHDDAAYFIMPRPEKIRFPFFNQKENEALQLSFSRRERRVRSGETIDFAANQALRVLEATLKEKAEYTVFFRPKRDDDKSVGAKEAERYIGGAAFSLRSEGRREEATVSATEDGKFLRLSATVALQSRDERPTIEVPTDREGLKLGRPEIQHDPPRHIVYPLTLPAAAFEPITVALEPKRALYGKEEAARSYPGRNCRMQLEVGRRKLRVTYDRDARTNSVVLRLYEGGRAPPSLMEARNDLADLDRVAARVLRYPDEGFRKDSDGRPCEGELAVANMKLDERSGRLTGSLRLPLERPILLGLVAPKTAGEFDAPQGDVRKLMDRLAREFVLAMDAAYRRERTAWSTADVLAVAGGDADREDFAGALPERLMAGGLHDERSPEDLLLVGEWLAALGRGWESGIAAQANDFRAAIEAYRRRHGLTAEGQARITVLGFVSSSARRCSRWIEELGSLGPDVSVRLLIADDTRRDPGTKIRITECPGASESRDRERRVRIFTFPFAVAVDQRQQDVLAQLALGQVLEKLMRQ